MSSKSSWAAFVRSGGLDSYPAQEMDPPKKYDQLEMYWKEREFVLNGEVKFTASWFPRAANRRYKRHSNFFHLACRTTLPTYRLEDIIDLLISSRMGTDFNIDPCEDCVNWTEVFWEYLCKKEPTKNQAVACLKRLGLSLPLECEGHFKEELREFTHDKSTCGCYFCLAKPYEYEKKNEDWESVRASLIKEGYDMISWEERVEYYEKRYNAKLWSIEEGRSNRPWDLPNNWVYPDDDLLSLRAYSNATLPSKKLIAEVGKILTKALKCQRIPTLSELDEVMSKLTSEVTVKAKITNKTPKTGISQLPISTTTTASVDGRDVTNSNNHLKIEDNNISLTVTNNARPKRSAVAKVISYNEQSPSSESSSEPLPTSCNQMEDDDDDIVDKERKHSSTIIMEGDGDSDWTDCSEEVEDKHRNNNSLLSDDNNNNGNSNSDSMSLGSSGVESSSYSNNNNNNNSRGKKIHSNSIGKEPTTNKEEDMAQLKTRWYSETSNEKDIFWHENFDAMVCYGKKNGTCNVVRSCHCQLPDGRVIKLGQWLNNQRQAEKKKKLSKVRFLKLQSLVDSNMLDWKLEVGGFIDNIRWNEMYTQLLNYGEQHSNGNCNVPQDYIITLLDNTMCKLGRWLTNQRQEYRKGILHEDRKQTLKKLVDEGKLKWKMNS